MVMSSKKTFSSSQQHESPKAQGIARLLPPMPLFALQPLLRHIVTTIAGRHPELFSRLGDNCKKRFLIDPTNLPFFLLLQPDPAKPQLHAYNRGRNVEHDVCVSATFQVLLRMIDAQTDSDALFFNRELAIAGDTEAIVALRNAVDDMDTTLADDVAGCFGPLSRPVRSMFDLASTIKGAKI